MPKNIVIVGAGIIGAISAYRLTQSGANVTVVDAGSGRATDASFGWINASFFADAAHFRLRAEGIAAYQRLTQTLNVPVETPGSLVWEDVGDAFDRQLSVLNDVGAKFEVLDRQAFQAREPHVADPPARAMHFPSERVASSGILTDRLLAAAQDHGARMISGVHGTGLELKNDEVVGLQTSHGSIPADDVLVAAGNGTSKMLASVGVSLPTLDRPGLMLRTRPVAPVVSHVLASPEQELRQLTDGSILAPAAASHQGDASAELDQSPVALADQTIQRLQAMLPTVALDWDQLWLANRPMPQDGLPAVGAVGPRGLYAATMHSGITLAALMGELVAGEILNGPSNHSADYLAPYRPDRFAKD